MTGPFANPVFLQALAITGKGMLSLFIFMGIFYLITRGLLRFLPPKEEKPVA
jgi:hypothetical protein